MHSTTTKSQHSRGVIEYYREFLPVSPSTPIISLGEGNTPLIYSPRLSQRVGRGCEVFVKNEGVNPTGSFKDRGMTVAVSKAMERGTNSAHLCFDREHFSFSSCVRGARRDFMRRDFACGKNRDREIASGFCLRSENRRGRRQFR